MQKLTVIIIAATLAIGTHAGTDVPKVAPVKCLVRSQSFPEINVIVNVRNPKTGKGVYGLTKEAFAISEDGFVQTITGVDTKTDKKVDPIDIVFIFDKTGSMQNTIDAVRDNAMHFAEILQNSNMDYRLALITFSDIVENKYNFTNDISTFKKNVSAIKASGGDDEPENALEALNAALQLKFRPGAKVVFILITDASYHQKNVNTKLSMLPLAKKIKLEGIQIYPITVDLEQYVWMARETDGQYFNITSDFASIIEQLAVGLTAQYVVRYSTTQSSYDNTKRMIDLKVKGAGTVSATYKSPANIIVSSQLIEANRPSDAYKAANLVDGKPTTAWAEGADGPGIGEWVWFGFDKPKKIKAIKIIGGYAKTEAVFFNNNRLKKVRIIFVDGTDQVAELKDTIGAQRILIDREGATSIVKIEIMEVYKGSKFDDTCISEIEFEY